MDALSTRSLPGAGFRSRPHAPAILCVGARAEGKMLERALRVQAAGYILEREAGDRLAHAVVMAGAGQRFASPGVAQVALDEGVTLPEDYVVWDGRAAVE